MFLSNAIFGTEARVFPWREESFLGTDSSTAWKSAGYHMLYPVKVVLIAPILPFDTFLQDDPPPPFVAAFFALYWSLLALGIHYLLSKIKHS